MKQPASERNDVICTDLEVSQQEITLTQSSPSFFLQQSMVVRIWGVLVKNPAPSWPHFKEQRALTSIISKGGRGESKEPRRLMGDRGSGRGGEYITCLTFSN